MDTQSVESGPHSALPDALCLDDIAASISLTTEQLVQLCRVSRRQLTYWIKRGIIPDDDACGAIDRILLIKSQLRAGSNLRQAARYLERYLKDQETLLADHSALSERELADICVSRLDSLDHVISRLRDEASAMTDEGLVRLLRDLASIDLKTALDFLPEDVSAARLQELGHKLYLLQRLAAQPTAATSQRARAQASGLPDGTAT